MAPMTKWLWMITTPQQKALPTTAPRAAPLPGAQEIPPAGSDCCPQRGTWKIPSEAPSLGGI